MFEKPIVKKKEKRVIKIDQHDIMAWVFIPLMAIYLVLGYFEII